MQPQTQGHKFNTDHSAYTIRVAALQEIVVFRLQLTYSYICTHSFTGEMRLLWGKKSSLD